MTAGRARAPGREHAHGGGEDAGQRRRPASRAPAPARRLLTASRHPKRHDAQRRAWPSVREDVWYQGRAVYAGSGRSAGQRARSRAARAVLS